MKKIIFLFVVLTAGISSFAQLEILSADSSTVITGDTLQLVLAQPKYFNVHNSDTAAINYDCYATNVVLPSNDLAFEVCTNGNCANVNRPTQIGVTMTLGGGAYADPKPDVNYDNFGIDGDAFLELKYQNTEDSTDTAVIYFSYSLIAALNSIDSGDELTIAPNPADANVRVSYSLKTQSNLVIYDNYGRKVQSIQLQSKKDDFYLNTSNLQSGIYFIKTGNVAKKLIVRH